MRNFWWFLIIVKRIKISNHVKNMFAEWFSTFSLCLENFTTFSFVKKWCLLQRSLVVYRKGIFIAGGDASQKHFILIYLTADFKCILWYFFKQEKSRNGGGGHPWVLNVKEFCISHHLQMYLNLHKSQKYTHDDFSIVETFITFFSGEK